MIYILLALLSIFVYINQLINKDKRFQEVNKIEQIWRYRFYLAIPFKWIWYSIFGLKIYKDELIDDKLVHTNEFSYCRGKNLWKLLVGIQQGPMKWYYTSDEVFERLKNRYK